MKKILISLCTIGILSVTFASADTDLIFQRSNYHFSNPYCVGLDVGDVDNDGDLDIAAVSNFGGDFVYYNNGVDDFTRVYMGTGRNHRNDVVLVDFDNDGDLDISWGSGGLENKNGTFEITSLLNLPFIRAVAFADFNGDDYPDAVGSDTQKICFIAINQQGQGFQIVQRLNNSEEFGVDTADIDNDGDIDISVGNKIWINDGTGIFTDSQINLLVGNSYRLWDRDFTDLNNDGYIDIVIAEIDFGSYVLLNDKNGDYIWDGKRVTRSFSIAVGDIDKDGYIDIVTSDPFHIYLNDQVGGFGAQVYMNPSAGTNAPHDDVEVVDLDGDGYLDIILSDWKPEGFNGLATPKVFYRINPVFSVNIDIKPGSDLNCININGHGVVPVAINGSENFSVNEIDVESLLFNGLSVRFRGNRGPLCSTEDWNNDGYLDLICHFEDNIDSWTIGRDSATLSGFLFDGTLIEGTDSICTVP
jgi:hypothetical protein